MALAVAIVATGVLVAAVPAPPVSADETSAVHYSSDRLSAVADFSDWMSWIKGGVKLTEISIPAAHDAMTWRCPPLSLDYGWCNTQSMDTLRQLESGIRFLDVRARYRDNGTPTDLSDDYLTLAHGVTDLSDFNGNAADLDLVFEEVCGFLASHGRETVVIRLSDNGLEKRHESNPTSDEILDVIRKYRDRYLENPNANSYDPDQCLWDPTQDYTYYSGEVPLLKEVRGRIVLMIGGDGTGGIGYNAGASGNNTSLHEFGPPNTEKTGGDERFLTNESFDNHVDEVTAGMIAADHALAGDVWYLNQTNANTGGTPIAFASGTNPVPAGLNERFTQWLLGVDDRYADAGTISKTGVVYMDFPDTAFIGAVIAHNFDLATDLALADPDMEEMAGPFSHHAHKAAGNERADDRRSWLDRIWQHFIDDPSFQSVALKDKNKGSSIHGTDNGVHVASGWVHDVRYEFWLSSGAVPIWTQQLQDELDAAGEALTVKDGAGAIKDEMVSILQSRFPGYGYGVIVKEQPYDDPKYATWNMIDGTTSTITYQGGLDWAIAAWLYDPPTTPTAVIDGPSTAFEGDTITFDGTRSTASVAGRSLSYCWTLDHNTDCDGTNPKIDMWWTDEWAGTLTLTVDNGIATDSTTVPVEFFNVPPQVSWLSVPQETVEGHEVTITGEIDDPGSDTIVADVSFGDDSPPLEGVPLDLVNGVFEITHRYDDDPAGDTDQYTVTVSPYDGTDTGPSHIALVTVVNRPPQVLSLDQPTVDEGGTAVWHGTLGDPGDDTFTALAEWSDGTRMKIDPFVVDHDGNFEVSHVFADDDPTGTPFDHYTMDLTVIDDDGGSTTEQGVAVVRNLPPDIERMTLDTITEGSTASITVTFSDPGPDSYTLDVFWGDGRSNTDLQRATDGEVTLSHVYDDDNPTDTPRDDYLVTVRITDDDGGVVTGTTVVTVENVPPVIRLEPAAGDEGSRITVEGRVEDPGNDHFTAEIDWADGTPIVERPVQVVEGRYWLSHVYTDDDPSGTPADTYDVKVTLIDDDGGTSNTVTTPVLVRNVAPTIVGLASPTGPEGNTVTLAGRLVDPGDDELLARVDWGDGSGPQPIVLGAIPNGEFELEHVYADNGVYSVSVEIRDDDGGVSQTSTTSITVLNVAPSIEDLSRPSTTEAASVKVSGTVVDPGADTFVATVVWGDGSTDTIDPLHVNGDGRFVLDHVYADDDPTGTPSDQYVVRVQVVDDDEGIDQQSTVVQVDNVAPGARIDAVHDARGNAVGPEEWLDLTLVGLDLTVDARYTDVGTPDTHVTRIDWGDGTVELDPTGVTTVWTHAFETAGDHTVTVTVVDDDGGRSTVERVLHVRTAEDVLDDLTARLEVAIDDQGLDATSVDPLQDALDAIAGNGKSALTIIDGGKGDVTGPLLDAVTALESAGWTTDAELVALVGSSCVAATIIDATTDVVEPSDQAAVDRAIADLTAGDSSASPIDALGHYAAAMKELKKYV